MSCPRADTIYQHAPEPTVFISHVQFATSSLVENGDLVVTVNGTDVRGDTVASVAAMIRLGRRGLIKEGGWVMGLKGGAKWWG